MAEKVPWWRRWLPRRDDKRVSFMLLEHARWVQSTLDTLRAYDPELALEAARGVLDIMGEDPGVDTVSAAVMRAEQVTSYLLGKLDQAVKRLEAES